MRVYDTCFIAKLNYECVKCFTIELWTSYAWCLNLRDMAFAMFLLCAIRPVIHLFVYLETNYSAVRCFHIDFSFILSLTVGKRIKLNVSYDIGWHHRNLKFWTYTVAVKYLSVLLHRIVVKTVRDVGACLTTSRGNSRNDSRDRNVLVDRDVIRDIDKLKTVIHGFCNRDANR